MRLKRGDRGADVVELQRDLDRWGYPVGKLDGVFGAATEGAVLQFQHAEGLTPDGVAGRRTLSALEDGPSGTRPAEVRVRFAGVHPAAQACIAYALEDLGKFESPDGSNRGPRISHLVDGWRELVGLPLDGRAPPWCALAVSVWTARALGLGHVGARIDWSAHPFKTWRASTVSSEPSHLSILSWAEESGRLLPADGPAPVGSIVIMGRSGSGSDLSPGSTAGHVGIVLEDLGDRVKSIDGNVQNRVSIVTRKKSTLIGFATWW